MEPDPRDQLWQVSFETCYDCYYEEIAAEALIGRWQVLDETAKVLVAVTAGGSAVSGWALWNQPQCKALWGIIAGLTAVLAILHRTLGVPRRLRDWEDIQRHFASLRTDLDTFRYEMRVNPEFPVEEFKQRFADYRKRYGEGVHKLTSDILLTKRLKRNAQAQLNERLGHTVTQQ